MSPEEALAACEAAVRRSDPDRYFASLFAPAKKRPLLFALYAFNHEIAHAVEVTREPIMAEIRLQWWREAVEEARQDRPRALPAALGLVELMGRAHVSADVLQALIDARADEISSAPFSNLSALVAHVQATSGALMRVAASLLDSGADVGELSGEAGLAYGLAGVMRAIPFQAARGKTFLPLNLLTAEGVNTNDVLSERHFAGIRNVISRLALVAQEHFDKARRISIPKHVLPALLPGSLVPAYLRHVTRQDRNPLRDCGDVSLFRRQLILLRAATMGCL